MRHWKLGDKFNANYYPGVTWQIIDINKDKEFPYSSRVVASDNVSHRVGNESTWRDSGDMHFITNSNTMKKISNFIKKLTDADTQSLVRAGYLNGDLEPTSKCEEKMKEIMFFDMKPKLVEAANQEIADEEKDEAKK